MTQNKILIIGMNPANKPFDPIKGNATINRLNKWMDDCDIQYYSYMNTFDESGVAKKSKIDFKRLCTITNDYDKIIALGTFVSSALNNITVSHFMLPHPSPLNRKLNDKKFEQKIIKMCKKYLTC